jgi:L-threonylcarbamoyladenylate synthase
MEINIDTLAGGLADDHPACILISNMRVIPINDAAIDETAIEEAAEVLRRGGLVAFPTETVYGLGANALDASAVARIFAAKGRPSYNPLIVHVPSEAAARELVSDWPESASRLARAFWPGPLTLVLPKQAAIPDIVTAGLDSVALRVPAHPVALALLRATRLPLAAPSANRSMALSPTTAQHVARSLGDRVDLVLDGGPTTVGIESTVVDLRGPQPSILRPGLLGAREIEPVVGVLAAPNETTGDAARPAPGMLDRHYAPRAQLRLFATSEAASIAREGAALVARGARVAALVFDASAGAPVEVVRMPADPAHYAQRLYATLHDLDESGFNVVLVERVPDGDAWAGVRDRLERASRP